MVDEISRIDSKQGVSRGRKRVEMLMSRRARLLHLIVAGMTISEAVEVLSKECGVRPLQVWRDWMSRQEWQPLLLRVSSEQVRESVMQLLSELKEAKEQAYQTYLSCQNEHARVNAIRVYAECVVKDFEVRQKLGLLAPVTFGVEQRVIMREGRFVVVGPDGEPITDDTTSNG